MIMETFQRVINKFKVWDKPKEDEPPMIGDIIKNNKVRYSTIHQGGNEILSGSEFATHTLPAFERLADYLGKDIYVCNSHGNTNRKLKYISYCKDNNLFIVDFYSCGVDNLGGMGHYVYTLFGIEVEGSRNDGRITEQKGIKDGVNLIDNAGKIAGVMVCFSIKI